MVQNYHVTAYRGLVTLSTLGANTQPLQITKLWKQHPGSCVCGWQKGWGKGYVGGEIYGACWQSWSPHWNCYKTGECEVDTESDLNRRTLTVWCGEKKICPWKKSETNGWTFWPAPMSPKAKHLWTFSFELSHPVTLRNKPTEMTWFLRYLVKPFYHITYIVQWI